MRNRLNPFLICLFILAILSADPFPVRASKPLEKPAGNQGNLNLIVGFRGGGNFSLPIILRRNEVLLSQDNTTAYNKKYGPWITNPGYQYAFLVMVYIRKKTSISFEPGFANYAYKYKASTGWIDGTGAGDYLTYQASHKSTLNYLAIPLIVRQEFGNGKIVPFVSLGLVYDYNLGASNHMHAKITQYTGTTTIPYESSSSLVNTTGSYIRSRIVAEPGIGFFYPLRAVKLMLNASLGFGMNNIVNESQRYNNAATTSGMYDVQDDMRLWTLNINLGILFNTGTNQAGKAVECVTFPQRKR